MKPDYRKLIPIFSVAYFKTYNTHPNSTLQSHTIPAILVGNDAKSDGRLFYNPSSKQMIGTGDYRLDLSLPSGPAFQLSYDGDPRYSTYNPKNIQDVPPTFPQNSQVYITDSHDSHPNQKATVINFPIQPDDVYVVLISNSNQLLEITLKYLQQPPSSPSPICAPSFPLIEHDEKVTLYLPDSMEKPQQEFIKYHENFWSFLPGYSPNPKRIKKPPIPLPNFLENCKQLYMNKQISPGWKTFTNFLHECNQPATQMGGHKTHPHQKKTICP
mmetsp:Transcript_25281/g.38332  ORF Transcript_25281/g.38332 Transcript_25281/m.38332 type:complete len:271 (-) Transcript_25281:568-1380(-)